MKGSAKQADRDGRKRLRILVLGAAGMLGHKMFQLLGAEFADVWGTMRGTKADAPFSKIELLQTDRILDDFDASDWPAARAKIAELKPHVVVNCIGVIKQRAAANSAIPSITINALLPHLVAETMREWDGRLIHISSDCVFSGNRGNYKEDDPSDALDLYGRSKFLGEIAIGNVLTLRTSIIGRELHHHESLLDWFLQQNHKTIRGFRRALWSGVTTIHLSKLVAQFITSFPDLRGLYQISSGRMSKHDLLVLLGTGYGLDIQIEPDDTVHCDRSLDGSRLAAAIAYQTPRWDDLVRELVDDPTPYDRWTRLGRIA
jgi:dTDP-4-dehydrorhamnose reductase